MTLEKCQTKTDQMQVHVNSNKCKFVSHGSPNGPVGGVFRTEQQCVATKFKGHARFNKKKKSIIISLCSLTRTTGNYYNKWCSIIFQHADYHAKRSN